MFIFSKKKKKSGKKKIITCHTSDENQTQNFQNLGEQSLNIYS